MLKSCICSGWCLCSCCCGGTSLLTDIVVRSVTVHIIPEVVPVEEEGVVDLHHAHAVLSSVVVVRLSICPVEPLDSLVLVRPDPLPGVVLTVTLPCEGRHPELDPVAGLEVVEQLGLEPVVDTGVVQLSNLLYIYIYKYINTTSI